MKKFISVLISSAMLFSSSVYAQNASELSSDFWAYSQLQEAYSNGWLDKNADVNGYASRKTVDSALAVVFGTEVLNSDALVTRGELADILAQFLFDDGSEPKNLFPDSGQYAYSIQKCCDAGIMKGYSDGTFKSDKPVTNAELAAIISNLNENIDGAFEAYTILNENYKTLKSFTMDFDMNMSLNVPVVGEETIDAVSNGSVKTVVNDLEKLDFEMMGKINTSAMGVNAAVDMYYKDNTYYMNAGGSKVKQTLNFKDMASQMGVSPSFNSDFERESFVSGFVKEKEDGGKDIYGVFDINDIMDINKMFEQSYLSADLIDAMDLGYVSMVMHTDKNGVLQGYDLYFDMNMTIMEQSLGCVIEAKYNMKDMNNTVIEAPTDLGEYKEIDAMINSLGAE